jgi:D-alanyl-lipoteichoic acid acyltransferase DltB (MBOAT superfamily)
MLFNSFEYIFLFLPLTFAVYFFLNRSRLTMAGKAWLAGASLFFYAWWDARYLGLIIFSIALNYVVGAGLRRRGTRPLLAFGILANLAVLGYYKYADFFIKNVNMLTGSQADVLNIVLPLGISFFTFTQIAYLVDVYRGYREEGYDIVNYTLFVTFFPHLLAGPIIHHKEMMPQFDRMRGKVLDYRNIYGGLFLLSMGLFKKVCMADMLLPVVQAGFQDPSALNLAEAWVTSLSYTFQIYFDFSGYTDIALGSALLFNIKLPKNFNSPYKALDIQDFWRRWHMTLSRFLRDYVYIPLGGNRRAEVVTLRNLFVTFLIGGLWHGAGWTFVLWGALHGAAMVVHRLWKMAGGRMHRLIAWFLTFNFINLTWVFFRATDWGHALNVLRGMAGLNGIGSLELLRLQNPITTKYPLFVSLFFLSFPLALLMKNTSQIIPKPNRKYRALIVMAALVAILNLNRITEFIYFNF